MKKGFTLVELAIVLVIIGVLVAGIIKGAELIKVAQIHKIMIEAEDMKRAYLAFQLKFDCTPGDCNKAQQFISPSLDNGNGDGEITPLLQSGSILYENLLAFEHMGQAELYKQYSKKQDCYLNPAAGAIRSLFEDCGYPVTTLGGAEFLYQYNQFGTLSGPGMIAPGGAFVCANTSIGCLSAADSSSLSGEDARTLDTIFDDGKPFAGRVLSACTTAVQDFSSYDSSHNTEVYDALLPSCPAIIKF